MATQKEQTLKINDFLGISRYYNSPNQPPNKLATLQNMYSPVKGELALLGGVTNITGTGHPGSTEIKHIEFLKTAAGYERVLVFFDHADLPTPSAPTAAPVTGSGFTGSIDVYVSWVGMGGESAYSAATAVACGAGKNIQITVPAFPTGIVSMNIFTSGVLAAVVSKRSGVSLPATVTLSVKPKTLTAGGFENRLTVKDFELTFGTSGTLEAGKTYFFGISPNVGDANLSGDGAYTVVTTNCGQTSAPIGVVAPTGRIFSFTVPSGYSSVQISLNTTVSRQLLEGRAGTAPYEWTVNSTDTTALSAWIYAGTTPEDLMVVGNATIDGTASPVSMTSTHLDCEIWEIPYNSNITTFKQATWTPVNTDYSDAYNFISLRVGLIQNFYGYENDSDGSAAGSNSPDHSGLGIYAQRTLAYADADAYQIMPARGCGYYSLNNTNFTQVSSFSSVFVPYSAGQFIIEDYSLQAANYLNRLYFVNGQQSMFMTNGYVMSTAPRKKLTPYQPITTLIRLFNEKLVLGGGQNSLFNTSNVVYNSAGSDPETWTASPSATASLSFVSALDADSDILVGLGVYSESLSSSGNNAFLVIGKQRSCYTWNGSSSSGAVQIAERTGFASKDCFSLTNYGPVFIGRENVFRMLSNGQAQKIGNDVEPILKSLTDDQIQTIKVEYNELHLKIGYQGLVDTDPRNIDSEIWLNIRQDAGDIFPIFTGPHLMKSYTDHRATNSFDSEREVRISFLGTKIYQRDDLSSYLNDTAYIPILIESNDIGFGADEFSKVITQFFMRAKIRKSENITLGLTVYDSSSAGRGLDYSFDNAQQTYSPSMILPYGGTGVVYRNFQKQFPSRYRGDMLRFTLALSTNLDFRIQSMNWLFNIGRRRLL